MHVVILGAGAIGCYVGGHWGAAGVDVTLLGRRSGTAAIRKHGLVLENGETVHLGPDQITATAGPGALKAADLIVLTVKATALDAAMDIINQYSPAGTPVVSLQNGLEPVRRLRAGLNGRPIIGGMVPFNVVWEKPATFRRSSIGDIRIAKSSMSHNLAERVEKSGVPVLPVDDIEAVQYGKLLLNLNNPINALSGQTLFAQIRQRLYRRVFSGALTEALKVLDAAGIRPARIGVASPRIGARLLLLPDALFNTVIVRMQKIDKDATTSMAIDLDAKRPTEIETLNGEIVRLGETHGVATPVNASLVRLIHEAEAGGKSFFTGEELLAATGLA